MPGPPALDFTLSTPTAFVRLTRYVTQEEAAEISDQIERFGTLNNFTAADVTVKCRDRSLVLQPIFEAIEPGSADFRLTITKNGLPVFSGLVYPQSVTFDTEGGIWFTAFNDAKKLATTSAAGLFKRQAIGWVLATPTLPGDTTVDWVEISQPTVPIDCPFAAGDQVKFGALDTAGDSSGETVTITQIYPTQLSQPYTTWFMRFTPATSRQYAIGTPLILITDYQRNVKLHDLVDGLFDAAGLNLPRYNVGALPLTGTTPDLVRATTPISNDGILGTVRGVSPNTDYGNPGFSGYKLWITTSFGRFEQPTPPTSAWILEGPENQPPVDPTNYGALAVAQMFGPKFAKSRIGNPRTGAKLVFSYFAYDYTPTSLVSPYTRYEWRLTFDTSVFPFEYTLEIRSWQSTDLYTWTTDTLLFTVEGPNTTTTDVTELFSYNATFAEIAPFGIDIDPGSGQLWFTDLTNGGVPGAELDFQLSNVSGLPGAPVLNRAIVADRHGRVIVSSANRFVVFELNNSGVINSSSNVYVYEVTGVATVSEYATFPISAWVVPTSLKYNGGDSRWYWMENAPESGVYLVSYPDEANLGNYLTALSYRIAEWVPGVTIGVANSAPLVDLAVFIDPGLPPGEAWPMVCALKDTVYLVSNQFSGVIAYANLKDLSCADALQQLATLVDAVYYVWPDGQTFFRSRDLPDTAIGPNTQLDGPGALTPVKTAPIILATPLYVRVINEEDETIFGEAGDPQYAQSDNALELRTRFVPNRSYATLVAYSLFLYVGSKKWFVEIERLEDQTRDILIGKQFTATAGNAVRTFQITGITTRPFSILTVIQGAEV